MWHEQWSGDPRITCKNSDGGTDAVVVDKQAVFNLAGKKKKKKSR